MSSEWVRSNRSLDNASPANVDARIAAHIVRCARAPVSISNSRCDGTTNGTGWAKPGDELLAMDHKGNGMIDSGSELFGINTRLSQGSLDTNDSAFAKVPMNESLKIELSRIFVLLSGPVSWRKECRDIGDVLSRYPDQKGVIDVDAGGGEL